MKDKNLKYGHLTETIKKFTEQNKKSYYSFWDTAIIHPQLVTMLRGSIAMRFVYKVRTLLQWQENEENSGCKKRSRRLNLKVHHETIPKRTTLINPSDIIVKRTKGPPPSAFF